MTLSLPGSATAQVVIRRFPYPLRLAGWSCFAVLLTAADAQRVPLEDLSPIYDKLPTTDHVWSVDASSIPPAWKDAPRQGLFYLLPVPADPPEAAAGAIELDAQHHVVELDVGDKVRISPAALAAGWRFSLVHTEDGVLWPLPSAPRVFFARCPGKQLGALTRMTGRHPARPTTVPDKSWAVEDFWVEFHVRAMVPTPSHCNRKFDPPRSWSTGVLGAARTETGIAMHVGETFALQGPPACAWIWDTFKIIDREILSSGKDERGRPAITAIKKGMTEILLPNTYHCFPMELTSKLLVEVR